MLSQGERIVQSKDIFSQLPPCKNLSRASYIIIPKPQLWWDGILYSTLLLPPLVNDNSLKLLDSCVHCFLPAMALANSTIYDMAGILVASIMSVSLNCSEED